MIAVPLSKNFSWRHPPLITIGLILVNCFIFAVFQHDDDRRWEEAWAFYESSGLGELECELYRQYLHDQGAAAAAAEMVSPHGAQEEERQLCYRAIAEDGRFIERLAAGEVLDASDARMGQWHALRAAYDARMAAVITYHYGFRPADPRPFTLLSAMFLHGGWGHLIGNMIFLWLIGCLIEYGCRHVVYPLIYIVGGVAGTAFFWWLNPHSGIPLVGASGAIAGIMGAFAVFYGRKKVRIFLNLGFYFHYLTFAAIWLLPLWLGYELFQLLFDQWSAVAYAAHFGGLACGALLAWGARVVPGCVDAPSFAAVAPENPASSLIERALEQMGALAFPEARRLLVSALAHDPENIDIQQHLYTIDRQAPDSGPYHQTTARLLASLLAVPAHHDRACALFQDYMANAKPPRLTAAHYLRMSLCLVACGEMETARRILLALLRKSPRLPALPMALFRLGEGFRRIGREDAWQQCMALIQHHFPMSDEARAANAALRDGRPRPDLTSA